MDRDHTITNFQLQIPYQHCYQLTIVGAQQRWCCREYRQRLFRNHFEHGKPGRQNAGHGDSRQQPFGGHPWGFEHVLEPMERSVFLCAQLDFQTESEIHNRFQAEPQDTDLYSSGGVSPVPGKSSSSAMSVTRSDTSPTTSPRSKLCLRIEISYTTIGQPWPTFPCLSWQFNEAVRLPYRALTFGNSHLA